jgi:hypothetical protein
VHSKGQSRLVKRRLGELRLERRAADTKVIVKAKVISRNFGANMTFGDVEGKKPTGNRPSFIFYEGLGVLVCFREHRGVR